jgi:propanol-preferring alcohol dehydrogenase
LAEAGLAMVLDAPRTPLRLARALPLEPGPGQVRVRVRACAVCRTDLHVIDGDLTPPKLPLVPGHEIAGEIDALGDGVLDLSLGSRVGVPWLGWTCGECGYCESQRENLCDRARFTGYHVDGGFADFTLAESRFCLPLPAALDCVHAAPLLCAGLIGYRSLRMTGDALRLGFFGFGAAAHILTQVATWQGREVFAFTRPGDAEGQQFARSLGAVWAGGSDQSAPSELDAAIIFAPAGELVPIALRAVTRGGTVICGGIHMSDIPSFPYAWLWGERSVRSVANLTRRDGLEFLKLAPQVPVRTAVQRYRLEDANSAVADLRAGRVQGAAVLVMEP